MSARWACWRWPWSALWIWLLSWGLGYLGQRFGENSTLAWGGAMAACGALSWWGLEGLWRRLIVVLGLPLSLVLHGVGGEGIAPWVWVVGCAVLIMVYPVRAWRDAPWFPTRRGSLEGVITVLGDLQQSTTVIRVLDAGCGSGDGLREWRRVWPNAQLSGVERSHVLARLARWRCPGARIEVGDMWSVSWRHFDVVYLFQRPESMALAVTKAHAEMSPGAWLVSLEFEAPGLTPTHCLQISGHKTVWLYQGQWGHRGHRGRQSQGHRGTGSVLAQRRGARTVGQPGASRSGR